MRLIVPGDVPSKKLSIDKQYIKQNVVNGHAAKKEIIYYCKKIQIMLFFVGQ
jgi:hypothetical protein